MKKIYPILISLILFSCSIDTDDITGGIENLQELEAMIGISGCEPETFPFDDAGIIEVTNNGEFMYVSIVASEMYHLSQTKLHIADSENSFPTVGQGNLPPGQMQYKESFATGVQTYTFTFSVSDFKDCIYIASQSQFLKGKNSSTYWAGDKKGEKGNWSYFQYCIQNCEPIEPPCTVNAGSDKMIVMSYSKAAALPSWDEVRKLYLSLLDPGVDWTGSFDPSIWNLINDFNVRGVGDYTTEYTIEEGECSDSVTLTIRVVPD